MQMCKFSAALLLTAVISLSASGQTDESILLSPWEKGQTFEAKADALAFPSARLGADAGKLKLFESESAGRYRIDLGYDLNPTFGYDVTYLNLQQNRALPTGPRLPRQLTDVSLGIGSPITKIGENGFIAFTAAAGYAGEADLTVGRGVYGKGSFMYGYNLKKGTNLLFLIDYNGNRSFMPDVPLPAFAYSSRYDDKLAYVVGFPVSSILWNPAPHIKVDIDWYIPDSFKARAGWEFASHLELFTAYDQRREVFRTHDIPGDRRFFFREQRAEVGVTYKAGGLRVEVAGGYAMGRSFDQGFDSRDLHRIARLDDAPFVRFSLGFAR